MIVSQSCSHTCKNGWWAHAQTHDENSNAPRAKPPARAASLAARPPRHIFDNGPREAGENERKEWPAASSRFICPSAARTFGEHIRLGAAPPLGALSNLGTGARRTYGHGDARHPAQGRG